MTSGSNNNCSSGSSSSESSSPTDIKQATPFNIGTFGVLFVFCIIIALTSSLYYNWPAIERILVDDKVFQNLCTKDEIYNAIDGMFVCDEQRKQIGNLAIIIFYTEFIAFAIGGLLADIVGPYIVLVLGFMFGFGAFIILYFFFFDNRMIKVSFAFWGMFGGFIFITSIQFPKMFPEATSLADGMIIMFDNISGLMPIIIYKLMKKFNLKYYEAFATYILWGIILCFVLTLSFIPNRIIKPHKKINNHNQISVNIFGFTMISNKLKNFQCKLGDKQLWLNYIIFSIPVTCSIFYKKTFSTYFLKNQTLVKIFPIIMLFVFVPTIFIAALNQFMGVHITSCILYIFYIISFVCFLYPTKQYGLLSIILFVISTSAAEQQTMTYISENHQQNESTLLGISYAVDFIVGSILQRIFDRIFDRSPMSILYVIIPLFLICICYSLYCATDQSSSGQTTQTKSTSSKGLFLIFWLIPFCILCIRLAFNSFVKKQYKPQIQIKTSEFKDYQREKILTVSVVFYSFSFYYVCNTFMVITSIINFSSDMLVNERGITHFILLTCFFVIPQILVGFYINIYGKSYANITPVIISLLIFKFIMFYFSNVIDEISFILFSMFLIIYGFVFFLFIYMLAYYNFQITYVDRCYKTSLLHWGSMFTMFLLLRFFYHILKEFRMAYFVLWSFNICFFIYFGIILFLYIPYEMDTKFNFNSSNLPMPKFPKFVLMMKYKFKNLIYSMTISILISICNFGVLINMEMNKKIVFIFFTNLLIHRLSFLNSICNTDLLNCISKYLDPSLTWICLTPFVILFIGKYFIKDKLYRIPFFNAIRIINLLIVGIISTFSLLSIQDDLQKCCCTENQDSCEFNNKCCNGQRDYCVCRCLKKIINPGEWTYKEHKYPIIFHFYEYELKKVKEHFCCFYIGTLIGYLFLSIYLSI